jgi:hypothetical protein
MTKEMEQVCGLLIPCRSLRKHANRASASDSISTLSTAPILFNLPLH